MPLSIFNPYVIGGAALALMLVAGGAYFYGRGDGTDLANAKYAAAAIEQMRWARSVEQQLQQKVAGLETKVLEAQSQVRVETETIIREVPIYVTPETDRRYPLPCGFVRLHNSAAERRPMSEVTVAGCNADADPAPVAVSDAARVIADNYGAYHEQSAQLIGLQDAWNQALIILHPPTE